MSTPRVALRNLADINRSALPETTPQDYWFRYVDISAVDGNGNVTIPDEAVSFALAPSRARRIASAGSTLVSTVRTYLRAIGRVPPSHEPLVFSTGFATLEALSNRVDPTFLHFACRTDQFIEAVVARSTGVSYPAINPSELSAIAVPCPPLDIQRRIADFLDDQTTRIDNIISARQRQTEKLEEERGAELDAIVLGRRFSDQQSADWRPFGSLPMHWRQGRLRSVRCDVQTGPFGSQLHADDYVCGGIPVINPASITSSGLVALPDMAVDEGARLRLGRHVLQRNDVVLARRGALGRAGLVTVLEQGWLCGTGSMVVRVLDEALAPEYLVRVLRTRPIRYFFDSQAVGSTMANLNSRIVLAVPLPFPPAMEQAQIVGRCHEVEASLASRMTDLAVSAGLLQEFKRSLISAAVSGEFDVSTASGRGVPA